MDRLGVDRMADQLVGLFARAETEVRLAAQTALLSGATKTARGRRGVLGRIAGVLGRLGRTAAGGAAALVAAAYAAGAAIADRAPPGTPPVGSVNPDDVRDEAVRVLADNLTRTLEDTVQIVGRKAHDAFRREGLRHVAAGLVGGQSDEVTGEGLQRFLRDQGVEGFVDRAGRRWSLQRYADMVVRTTAREALSYGTINTLLSMGLDLVTVSEHDHPHDACTDFEGRTYSITGQTPGYPRLERMPPFHPNCRHWLTPA